MPKTHDGPISQGIRDAIRASGLTPYAIAKQVTQRGKVKLTGPQIYRFIKGDKGLSLAILDEIGNVLHLGVHVVPVEDRKAPGSPYRIVVQEAMDRLRAVAVDTSIPLDLRVHRLDQAHQSIRRETALRGNAEIYPLYSLYSGLRNQLIAEQTEAARASAPFPMEFRVRTSAKKGRKLKLDIPDDDEEDGEWIGGDGPLPAPGPFCVELPRPKFMQKPIDDDESVDDDGEDAPTAPPDEEYKDEEHRSLAAQLAALKAQMRDDEDEDDDDGYTPTGPPPRPPEVGPVLQAKLDALRPINFYKSGYLFKIETLHNINLSINEDPTLSELEKAEVGRQIKELCDRIMQENMPNDSDEWFG